MQSDWLFFLFLPFIFPGNLSNFSDETVDDDMYDDMESISMVEDVNASAMGPRRARGEQFRGLSGLFATFCK